MVDDDRRELKCALDVICTRFDIVSEIVEKEGKRKKRRKVDEG